MREWDRYEDVRAQNNSIARADHLNDRGIVNSFSGHICNYELRRWEQTAKFKRLLKVKGIHLGSEKDSWVSSSIYFIYKYNLIIAKALSTLMRFHLVSFSVTPKTLSILEWTEVLKASKCMWFVYVIGSGLHCGRVLFGCQRNIFHPIISKLDKHEVLLLNNYVAKISLFFFCFTALPSPFVTAI